jgi:hypothetical protein
MPTPVYHAQSIVYHIFQTKMNLDFIAENLGKKACYPLADTGFR